MEKFLMTMTNKTVWQFEVEAENYDEAYKMTFDWGRDELNEDEIIDNMWEVEIY